MRKRSQHLEGIQQQTGSVLTKAKADTPTSSKKKSKDASLFRQFSTVRKGKDNISLVNYQALRNLAKANAIVQTAINKIKRKVSKYPYVIAAKDKSRTKELQPQIKYLEQLLKRPNRNDETFRKLVSKILDDVLVIDNGVIEKVRNAYGYVVELYQVDGATIRPNMDDRGLYLNPAFYQYIDYGSREPDAEFKLQDVLVFQGNPQGDIFRSGFGYSPVEYILSTVTTGLQAMIYNASFFDEAKLPPALINLKGIGADEVTQFKAAWEASLEGKPWQNAYTNAEAIDVQKLRDTNQDMQFLELNMWLTRIVCSAFGISPQEMGLTMDINKATGEVQKEITDSDGFSFYADVIAEEINTDLIEDLADIDPKFADIEFHWDVKSEVGKKDQADIDAIYLANGVVTAEHIQAREGWNTLSDEEKTTFEAKQGEQDDAAFDDVVANFTKSQGKSRIRRAYLRREWNNY